MTTQILMGECRRRRENKRIHGRMECVRAAWSRVPVSCAPQTLFGNWNQSPFTDGKVEVQGGYAVDQYPPVSKREPELSQIPELSSPHCTELLDRSREGGEGAQERKVNLA